MPPNLVATSAHTYARLAAFVGALRTLQHGGLVLAYHDRSDGGLFATLAEMAFAGHGGVTVNLDVLAVDPVAADWGDFKIRTEQVSVRRSELMLKGQAAALQFDEAGNIAYICGLHPGMKGTIEVAAR